MDRHDADGDDDNGDNSITESGELTPLTGNCSGKRNDRRYTSSQSSPAMGANDKHSTFRTSNVASNTSHSGRPNVNGHVDDETGRRRRSSRNSNHNGNNNSRSSSGVVYVPVTDDGSISVSSSSYRRQSPAASSFFFCFNRQRTKCLFAVSTAIIAFVLCVLFILVVVSSSIAIRHEQLQNPNDDSIHGGGGGIGEHQSTKPWMFPHENDLFDDDGRYIFRDYDAQTTFADFLPGLAGIYGKPLWAFFVNRGQAIASFGVESKDTPIMEFLPANKAYQATPLVGFRTFIMGRRPGSERPFILEPFSPLTTNYPSTGSTRTSSSPNKDRTDINTQDAAAHGQLPSFDSRSHNNQRILYSGENEMQVQEIDYDQHLETNVTYFILPEEDFGAFVRRTTITNVHARQPISISVLDGLARMQPAGGNIDPLLKNMGRTLEGWMRVDFPYLGDITMPFYRLSTQPSDTDFIQVQETGHYCLCIHEGRAKYGEEPLLPIVYDTSKVFGEDTTLLRPQMLLNGKSISDIIHGPQYGKAKTSSCFAAVDEVTLGPGESLTVSSFYGATNHILDIPVIARRLQQEGFVQYKLTRTREVIRQITKSVETKTVSKVFNAHVSQMFLDNSLRGGVPIVMGDQDDNNGLMNVDEDPRLKVYHVFSRIHGDLERDYNQFLLRSTFFSEGPGSFRDVAQNRRNDVLFQPKIGSFNVRTFLSFSQADGYEPKSVEAIVLTISDKNTCDRIATYAVGQADGHRAQREALSSILCNGPFRPGQLFRLMAEQNIFLMVSRQEFIDVVAVSSTSTPMAVYETGFWADHWTYYLDMIETYISIFPDGEERLLFDTYLPYFFSPASVQPRSRKYVENLDFGGSHDHIQQLDATIRDDAKKAYLDKFVSKSTNWYRLTANWQHDDSGKIFQSSVLAKLFLLATLKFATRDAYGMGIEYEAGRPGWDDANNGIPGMLGSGMPETFELKALIQYLIRVTTEYQRAFDVPEELVSLIDSINGNLTLLEHVKVPQNPSNKTVPSSFFDYWDNVSTAREKYREDVKLMFSGRTRTITPSTALPALRTWLSEIDDGIDRASAIGTESKGQRSNTMIPTYFAYRVNDWKRTGDHNKDGHKLVLPLSMEVRPLTVFLEGPTRMLKTVNTMEARDIYLKVRNSSLYDEDLKMYTLSASLEDEPIEIGRSTAFAPGWLENQSVWLHMSYKFYLQLLRHGLYSDFFEEVQAGGLLPFMNAKRYGRSPMECSSFIVSSAFEDPDVRGRGFLGRLSGATAEFLSIWTLMFIGPKPFYKNSTAGGEVQMQLVPTLPAWLFGEAGKLSGEQKISYPVSGDDSQIVTTKVSFKLFSSISVHYHNKNRRDLMGEAPYMYRIGLRDGSTYQFDQPFIPGDIADKIRRVVLVDFIEAYF